MADISNIDARIVRRSRDRGAGVVEYSLLLVLLAIAVLTAAAYLGNQLDSNLDDSGNEIRTAVG